MSSLTVPRSPSLTAAPSLYATMSFRNWSALFNWPVACTVSVLSGPYSTPVGSITLFCRIALATCDTPMPRDASCCGSSCTRTAYLADPQTPTSATPSTIDNRCAIVVSAYSSICVMGSTFDVSASIMIGADEGLCLCADGGSMFDGRYGIVFEIAALTSCAALSRSRSSENWSVMFVLPKLELDVISSIPAMAENAFSSGVATVAAIVSGLAPGEFAPTPMVG